MFDAYYVETSRRTSITVRVRRANGFATSQIETNIKHVQQERKLVDNGRVTCDRRRSSRTPRPFPNIWCAVKRGSCQIVRRRIY
ncbi:hypothetical protein GWI33_000415 [Rhynchophorus ferrugineus]|uniref:Uncharacterized protein n=1 Tax=Rhynchophorus ferrugineus TaxID=354439 RepID=A0A834HT95_RHYFE|nr:hypothetical protein GWI33_000415 [Rhynchophorus ferrugineus]